MKADAVLINVARGPIVDEDALYEALATRRIAGAVLDTWYRYADTDDAGGRGRRAMPFHELDNVVMTPHCSGWTEGLMERRLAVIADNVERLQGGGPLINQVHPAAGDDGGRPPTPRLTDDDRAHASRTGLRAPTGTQRLCRPVVPRCLR